MSEDVSMEIELAWCKAVIADLQHQLDQKDQLLMSYENLVRDALGKLDIISKGVKQCARISE